MAGMAAWKDLEQEAPRIAGVFRRRHAAAGHLCLLATLRSDGYPRISPMEPGLFDGELVLVGMANTHKFADLVRDPRFSLHTATADPSVGDGDAKVWGLARRVLDEGFQRRFAEHVFEESGMDFRGERFDPFLVGDLAGASAVAFLDGELTLTIWKPGELERTQPLG
jgi:hypothetical protein